MVVDTQHKGIDTVSTTTEHTNNRAKTFLVELRKLRPSTDWRRDKAHPELAAFSATFKALDEAKLLSPVTRLEVQTRLARLAVDPIGTLDHLIAWYETASTKPYGPLQILGELAGTRWLNAVARLRDTHDSGVVSRLAAAGEAQMAAFAQRHPDNDIIQKVYARHLDQTVGTLHAIKYIENLNSKSRDIAIVNLKYIISLATKHPFSKFVDFLLQPPISRMDEISVPLALFLFDRAVIIENLKWNCGIVPTFGNADLRDKLEKVDRIPEPSAVLSVLADLLGFLPVEAQADHLAALRESVVLWRSPSEKVERTRVRLLEHMAAILQEPDLTPSSRARLLRTIVECWPQTIEFWSNAARRMELYSLVQAQRALVRKLDYDSLIGLVAFAVPHLDDVESSYAEIARANPSGCPHASYLDFRGLKMDPDARILNSETVIWSKKPSAAPSGSDRPVLITSCDVGYLRRHGVKYASTLYATRSTCDVHYHIIGNPGEAPDVLRQIEAALHRPITVSCEKAVTERSFYYATARFLRSPEFLRQFQRPIIVTDIDLEWNAKPELLLEQLDGSDIGLRTFDQVRYYTIDRTKEVVLRYPRLRVWEAISASCYIFKPTPNGLFFSDLLAHVSSDHLAKFIKKPGSFWVIDQHILYAAYALAVRKYPEIRFASIDSPGIPFAPYALLPDKLPVIQNEVYWMNKADFMP